jgi:hypothetical protein
MLQPVLRQALYTLDEFSPLALLSLLVALLDAQEAARARQQPAPQGQPPQEQAAAAAAAGRGQRPARARQQQAGEAPQRQQQQRQQQAQAVSSAQQAVLYRELYRQMGRQLHTYTPATLAATLSALAGLRQYDPRVFERAAALAAQQAASGGVSNGQACQLLAAYSRFQHPCGRLVQAVLPQLQAGAGELGGQQLVRLAWAAAQAVAEDGVGGHAGSGGSGGGGRDPALTLHAWALCQQALDGRQQLDASQLALLLSAAAIIQPAAAALPEQRQQQRAAAWSAADLQRLQLRLLDAAAGRPGLLRPDRLPHLLHTSLLLGAGASRGRELARLADVALDHMGLYEPTGLVLLLRCHACPPLLDLRLLDAYAQEAGARLRSFSPEALVQLLGALADAAATYGNGELVAAAARQLHSRLPAAAPQQLAAGVLHLGRLRHRPDALYAAAARQLALHGGECSAALLAGAVGVLVQSGSLEGCQHGDLVAALAGAVEAAGGMRLLTAQQQQRLQALLPRASP